MSMQSRSATQPLIACDNLKLTCNSGWSSDDAWIGHAFGTTTRALKIRPVWLREILGGTDPER